ncbi:MAG TPA: nickel pincer cofactor biosynthesis protein LarB [Clostridiaceae bacterium]|nr:nickel pincer cofactor biosynthesis protein LarB [Clostridiaceae bacterium]
MQDSILTLLEQVKEGKISPSEALLSLKKQPFYDLGFAKVDHHRRIRQGVAEVIYGSGKTPEQIQKIAEEIKSSGAKSILITRLSEEKAEQIDSVLGLDYDPIGRTGLIGDYPEPDGKGLITIMTAGTSDQAVAEEAARTARVLGNRVERIYDVGVAGLHRMLSNLDLMLKSRVIIVIAGMEGALPSVVGGLVSCPVIAVPTSVGYGASFEGLTALLSMLNSCASGVTVVNIDNGFGAAFAASQINHLDC